MAPNGRPDRARKRLAVKRTILPRGTRITQSPLPAAESLFDAGDGAVLEHDGLADAAVGPLLSYDAGVGGLRVHRIGRPQKRADLVGSHVFRHAAGRG